MLFELLTMTVLEFTYSTGPIVVFNLCSEFPSQLRLVPRLEPRVFAPVPSGGPIGKANLVESGSPKSAAREYRMLSAESMMTLFADSPMRFAFLC